MRPEDIIKIKELLPTSLGTDEIRERYASDILRRSIFSAKMEEAHYLAKVREVCARLAAGEINEADARKTLLDLLGRMGHSPLDEGGIKNPASIRRLNLILDTQRQMAASVARASEQTESTLHQFPAWELTRTEGRDMPRGDWLERWKRAGESVGFEGVATKTLGEMIALKNSPIWAALGSGAGGYRDTLGNPYPPFAFGSGMGWLDVERAKCVSIGLINDDEEIEIEEAPSLSPAEADILQAVERYGFQDLMKDLGVNV